MNLLKHENLWHAVGGYPTEDKTDAATRARRNEKALSKLCLSVDVSCIPLVMKAGTAKEAWDSLAKAYEDTGLNRRVRLLRSFFSAKLTFS